MNCADIWKHARASFPWNHLFYEGGRFSFIWWKLEQMMKSNVLHTVDSKTVWWSVFYCHNFTNLFSHAMPDVHFSDPMQKVDERTSIDCSLFSARVLSFHQPNGVGLASFKNKLSERSAGSKCSFARNKFNPGKADTRNLHHISIQRTWNSDAVCSKGKTDSKDVLNWLVICSLCDSQLRPRWQGLRNQQNTW